MDEQQTIVKDFVIPLGAGELAYHPQGSTYRDLNEKSPTFGKDIPRPKATLTYTHGRQRFSFARIDVKGLAKAFQSSKVLKAIDTLPETDSLEE